MFGSWKARILVAGKSEYETLRPKCIAVYRWIYAKSRILPQRQVTWDIEKSLSGFSAMLSFWPASTPNVALLKEGSSVTMTAKKFS